MSTEGVKNNLIFCIKQTGDNTGTGTMSVPYFLGYKTDFFSFQNNPKDLDPSYKMDLDL